jgi:hypothetical protein|tara:strand:+ start:1885 stop:2223 length:339 start_codon:yes stop_codon:yes gene_type:complete
MQNEINTLIETIKADYTFFMKRGNKDYDLAPHQVEMINEFNTGIAIKQGSKYIKVTTNKSVWGFIVNTDKDKKFVKGDILKAAGYNAPARNARRGNIVEGGYTVQWTGPLYL